MPAYNFMKQFVPMVENGSKPHTMRSIRKNPAKPGDTLSLYTDQRTKRARLIIPPAPCLLVRTIFIFEDTDVVLLDDILDRADADLYMSNKDELLSRPDANQLLVIQKNNLAFNDGFRIKEDPKRLYGCWDLMLEWVRKTHGLPYNGHLIYWDIPSFSCY